jgi:hypothetical protein
VSRVEQLTGFYDEDLAHRSESQERLFSETESAVPEVGFGIDLAELNGKINDPANAKAEAPSLIGEAKKGLEFANRHI